MKGAGGPKKKKRGECLPKITGREKEIFFIVLLLLFLLLLLLLLLCWIQTDGQKKKKKEAILGGECAGHVFFCFFAFLFFAICHL